MARLLSSNNRLRLIVSVAVFSGISALGGLLKLPSPSGSIALDSAPAFFAAGFISPIAGAFVGFFGHIASAISGGMPQGPLHLVIAIGMFVTAFLYGMTIRLINKIWSLLAASFLAICLNCSIPFFCTFFGLPMSVAIAIVVPFLIIAASVNVLLASGVLLALSKLKAPGI